MDEMKRELAALKTEVTDIQTINRRIIATLVRLEGKVDDLAERMATKDNFNTLMTRMDGFAGRLEDMRWSWAVHADILGQHDKRIKRLETRRA